MYGALREPARRFLSISTGWVHRPMGRTGRTWGWFAAAALCAILIGHVADDLLADLPGRLAVNATASEPEGLYWVTPLPLTAPLLRGERVVMRYRCPLIHKRCPFSQVAPYPDGSGFIKVVAGLPGDTVNSHHGVYTLELPDGRHASLGHALARSPSGIPIPLRMRWHQATIPAGEFFLSSTRSPASFDSRYFGLVPRSRITGRAHLLFTW